MEEEQILFSLSKGCQSNEDCTPACLPDHAEINYLGQTKCCPPWTSCQPPGYAFGVNSRSGIFECYDRAPPELLDSGSIDFAKSQGGPEYFGAWTSINFATPEECEQARIIAINWYSSPEGAGCSDHDFSPSCYFSTDLTDKIYPSCCDGTCCQVGEICEQSWYVTTSVKTDSNGNILDLTCSDQAIYPSPLGPYRTGSEAYSALSQLQGYNPDCLYAVIRGQPRNCLSPNEMW